MATVVLVEAAASLGIPQVVSLGAMAMCNFGPRDTVPDRLDELYRAWNAKKTEGAGGNA